jgi:GAF domain-containing protein
MSYSHLEPPNEPTRQLIIQKYKVPTAFQEPIFQEITTLAAHIFNLPVAFLSVVDSAQVDFPATYGVAGLHTLPREAALCSMAVQQHATVVLNSISQGSDSPHWQTAQRFQMEFYAGAPLLMEQHYAVGALCLSDHQPRAFSAQEEEVLTQLAAIVSQAVTKHWQAISEGGDTQLWQTTQQLAMEDIRLLQALLHHLDTHPPDAILHVVQRRLGQLQERFAENSSSLS